MYKRQLYGLTLDHAEKGSNVLGAGGQIYFEWADVCEGWAVVQRYRLRLFFSGSEEVERQANFTSWEAKNGRRYRFEVKKIKNDRIDEDVRGLAQLPKGKPGSVLFAIPEGTRFPLSREVLFPSAHTIAILEAAKAKQNFLSKPVFDGVSAEGASTVSVAIGAARFENDKHVNPLLKGRSWATRMAYFQDSSGVDPQTQGEKLPDFELSADILENGITRSMLLDHGNFVIKARLLSVEPLTQPKCS